MVIALFSLALAMIVGGMAAMYQGWDIILVERGWSLVIAGSVTAASGAILLGIAAAVARLGRLRSDLAQLGERLARSEPMFPQPPVLDPVAAVSAGLLSGGALGADRAGPAAANDEAQPTLPLFMQPPEEEQAPGKAPAIDEDRIGGTASGRADARPRIGVADDLFEEGGHERPQERGAGPEGGEDGTIAGPLESAPEAETRAAPEREAAAEPSTETGPAARPATVIGTYNSGGNRYVMFSDGSIEAETPKGVFRFGSLDELKEFIAAGGEGGSPAAT